MHTTTAADVVLAIWGQENVPLTVGEVPVAFPRELVPPEPVVTLGGRHHWRGSHCRVSISAGRARRDDLLRGAGARTRMES
jgi:hypothetical protein